MHRCFEAAEKWYGMESSLFKADFGKEAA